MYGRAFDSPEDEKATEEMASDGREESPTKSSGEEVQSVEAVTDKGQEAEADCEVRETKPEVEAYDGQEKSDVLSESKSSSHPRESESSSHPRE